MKIEDFYPDPGDVAKVLSRMASVEELKDAGFQATIFPGGEGGSFGGWTLVHDGLVTVLTGEDGLDMPESGECVVVTTYISDADAPDEPDADSLGCPEGSDVDGDYNSVADALEAFRNSGLIK